MKGFEYRPSKAPAATGKDTAGANGGWGKGSCDHG
jgi:hypothetical protein